MSLKIEELNSKRHQIPLTGVSAVAQRAGWWALRMIDGVADQMENGDLWTSHGPSHACYSGEK